MLGFLEQLFKPGHSSVKWYKSLGFLGVIALTLIPLWDMIGIFAIMENIGKPLVLDESSRLMEQTGNNVVQDLMTRSKQIEGLCRTVAGAAEKMPSDATLYRSVLPNMIDFKNDMAVAGGGVWPEPGAFTPGVKLRSFFWGRDEAGKLKYYDDYNTGRGYHNDEWYPVVRFSKPGDCFWSRSYMDPYSYQPMVTCTVAIRKESTFAGVATVDLKLEGLQSFIDAWRKKTGGYLFVLDRNNKFLVFPDPGLVKKIDKDEKGKRTEEFMTANDFAAREKEFLPIAEAVTRMNQAILNGAEKIPGFDPTLSKKIDDASDQIDADEAKFIAAVIADPLGDKRLYEKFDIRRDFLNKEASTVFIFHVPQSYWKVVIVKPVSESQAVAAKITRVILFLIGGTILAGVLVAAYLSHRLLTAPLRQTTDAVTRIGQLVAEKKFHELDENKIETTRQDELGHLSKMVNTLCSELSVSYSNLVELNARLEQKVEARTAEIRKQADLLSEQNKKILDSISYAKRIEEALLWKPSEIAARGIDAFVISRPRDIVSGDFYWFAKFPDIVLAAVIDCTGHGVPGAFMSMIGNTILNEIVVENRIQEPGIILGNMHDQVRKALRQDSGDSRDGMDVALVRIDLRTHEVRFAGARRHLYFVNDSTLTDIKGSSKPIGGLQKEQSRFFETHSVTLKPGAMIYLTSDGYADQPGQNGEKIGSMELKRLLEQVSSDSTENQKLRLEQYLSTHQGTEPQRDDITVVGIKIVDFVS
ncbi:MAG: SpoIIE family protein phosphatase [Leptospirales bacterium]|nr:SpoIIE family protein phosphatase [Leptospirales bacterium]